MIRLSTILSLSAAVISGVSLFLVSQGVQKSENDVYRLERAVSFEQKTEDVLRAEWDYLNTPLRLEQMAAEYLGMVPPVAGNISTSTTVFPDYRAPVVPQRRPDFLLREAGYDDGRTVVLYDGQGGVFQGREGTDRKVYPRPPRKPSSLSQGSFDDLLGRLGTQGGQR